MAFVLCSEIKVGELVFSGVHQVNIKKELGSPVETATIKLPAHTQIAPESRPGHTRHVETSTLFKNGDKVYIKLGYDGMLMDEFKGFVKRKNLSSPFELECEGYSYQLLRTPIINKSWKAVKLHDVLKMIIADTDIIIHHDTPDTALSGVMLKDVNGYDALEVLKKQGHIFSSCFINSNELYCGPLYTAQQEAQKVTYWMGWNTTGDEQLKYRTKQDAKVLVRVYYKDEKGKTKQTITGEKGGQEVKAEMGRMSAEEARQKGMDEARQKVYEGYEGKIKGLLLPYCQHGWRVELIDERHKERGGIFIAEGVEIEFGTSGAFRSVQIGKKINV